MGYHKVIELSDHVKDMQPAAKKVIDHFFKHIRYKHMSTHSVVELEDTLHYFQAEDDTLIRLNIQKSKEEYKEVTVYLDSQQHSVRGIYDFILENVI